MSYTLRGRLESRLVASLAPAVLACVLAALLESWWPIELAAVMVAVGLVLDALVFDRVLPYQPGWVAVPIGLAELAVVMAAARMLDIMAPLPWALGLFGVSWLVAQILGHAVFPLVHLSYAEDGGELGRGGAVLAPAVVAVFAFAGGIAWGTQPPTIHLDAGMHDGPLLLDRSQRLIGEPGTVVRGGIRITADDVLVRGIRVVGGRNGIEVVTARDVVLEDVHVTGAAYDGIHARRASVTIRDCRVERLRSPYAQGIDLSFAFDLRPSVVERCRVTGGQEGIVANSVRAMIHENHVERTTLRAITINEMAMADVEKNVVEHATGVGIMCIDYSMCRIRENAVLWTKPDLESDNAARAGYAIQSSFGSVARIEDNRLVQNARDLGAFADARFERD